jgi:YggT family protein
LNLLLTFIGYTLDALTFAILGRIIMSWISPSADNPINVLLHQITEPILGPIRRIVPPLGMFDLTPMVAILLLYFIRNLLSSLLQA